MKPGKFTLLFLALIFLKLGNPTCLHGADQLEISEFMASNDTGLVDENGAASDWIEIHNAGTNTVNLGGWYLTDDASNLIKWQFPATNIFANAYLVVFASNKNRALAGAPLHTNFKLDAAGEYLALVRPDGVTVVSEFAPQFPEQFKDISFGIAQNIQVTKMISNTSPVKVLVPTGNLLGATWVTTNFNDLAWSNATNGVGYETYVSGFAVRNIRANIGVCDLGTADGVLVTPSQQAGVFTENRGVINYFNSGGVGNFGGDFTFPGFSTAVDENNFVTEATGVLTILTNGSYTFGVNSDDGFRCDIGVNTFSYPSPRGSGDTLATFNLTAGEYAVRLVFYECGGGSELEFFAAAGSFSAYNANFRLVGDTTNGGLAVKSLPISGATTGSYRSLVATDVQSQMLNKNASAYLRFPFTLTNPANFTSLTLQMKYDDGFVAYLNGTEIARRNAPASPQWNSAATGSHSNQLAVVYENINVSPFLNLLQAGPNVLAVQGLNDVTNGSDFLIVAELAEFKTLGTTNHYFSAASPGAPNSGGVFAFVENLKFTPGRGWFETTNLSIQITSATPGITIRYTTNGSAPNLTNGYIYTSPILTTNTTTLRAIGFRDGFEPTDPETHSYIFLDQVQRQSTNVNWAGGSSGNYSLDPGITQNAPYRDTFKSDLLGVPTLSIALDPNDLFGPNGIHSNPGGTGPAWERPGSIEYMRPDGLKGFNMNCGVRLQGGASRSIASKHGFRLLFKSVYGPSKLDYNLYPESPVKDFDTIDLHASFNDHWLWGGAAAQMIRDPWCRDTQNAMGGYGPHGTFVHLYLNSIYWGLYNIGEKGDASYAAHYLGGDKTEYDALNSDELVDGTIDAWNTMFSFATAPLTNDVGYTNLSQQLDVPNFIDYMLLNFYAANTDWPSHNWNAAHRRVPGATWHFFSWDAEWTMFIGSDVNTDRTGVGFNDGSPSRLYVALRGHPEFRMQFADHAQKHLFNGGALTPAACDARFMKRATEIDRAIVPESARWGNGNNRQTWINAQTQLRTQWFPQRTAILINQLRTAALYPSLNAPVFTPLGGLVPPGYSLAITNPNATGTIYFTLDGSDPRLWGGALALSAQAYSAALRITNAVALRTRVKDGTNWSAIMAGTFYVVQDFRSLAVTEIMCHPPNFGATNGDEVEFLELKNTGTNTLDLTGLYFADGIGFTFTNDTRLAPGAFFVLARNPAMFAAKYPGIAVNGVYTGKLDNNGEQISLVHVLGTNVFSFSYDTKPPWPITPDGYGFSLVRAEVAGDPAVPTSWRPSANVGGSPGADDPISTIPKILVNEILTHTLSPQVDAIELFNPGTTNVNLGGWFLTDDANFPTKYRIPSDRAISAGGYLVFTEADFNSTPGATNNFSLSSLGEDVLLFSGDANTNLTGYGHGISFGAAAAGVTFGRYVISTSEEYFPAQIATSLGGSNAGPAIGPVVINEVQYNPALGDDEFIELRNITSSAVSLFDPALPSNTWKLNGLGYHLPTNVTLEANAILLIVPTDPAEFRAKYGVLSSVQILGPYLGVLQDSGERLELQRPDSLTTNALGQSVIPFITVDEVRFNDKLPWPLAADGGGSSLQRRISQMYGNEPTNWFAAGFTPGGTNAFNYFPPKITKQPLSLTVKAGSNVTFSVSVTNGLSRTYQWSFKGTNLLGATNASLVVSNAQPVHEGIYLATFTDGVTAFTTQPAMLTVLVPPMIVQQPEGLLVAAGSNVTFTVVATGALPMGFQWRKQSTPLTNYSLNANTGSFTLFNVKTNDAGNYRVVITNPANTSGVPSAFATLTVMADGNSDPDGDGMTNLQEAFAGTDPNNPQSYLRIDSVGAVAGGTVLRFNAVSNKTYTVLGRESLSVGTSWASLTNVSAAMTNRIIIFTNAPAGVAGRFYRLVTPQAP